MSANPNMADFLAAILPPVTDGQYIEVRFKQGDIMKQAWAVSPENAANIAEEVKAGGDVYFGIGTRNGRSGTNADVARIQVIPADVDFAAYPDGEAGAKAAINALTKKGLKPAAIVSSGGGYHVDYLLTAPQAPSDRLRVAGKRLAATLSSPNGRRLDAIDDPARVLRVPGTLNYKYEPPRPVSIYRWWPQNRYTLEEMEAVLGRGKGGFDDAGERDYQRILDSDEIIPVGNRHKVACSLLGLRKAQGWSLEAMLAELQEVNRGRFAEPLSDKQLDSLVDSVSKYPAPELPTPTALSQAPKPTLDDAALHGLVGDIVHTLEPHTEACAVNLLAHTLVLFGNFVGRSPYFVQEADRHHGNLFVALIGRTSKGRKGSGLGQVRQVFEKALENVSGLGDLWSERVCGGLSTGEGLIKRVRDPARTWRPERKDKKGQVTRQGEYEITDPGVEDKRLCVIQGEFSKMLRVMARDQNTLSPILREAWDGLRLETLTKGDPMRATGAHISVVAHGVKDEVLLFMDRTEFASGFGNRFLWLLSERSKELPYGGNLDPEAITALGERLKIVLDKARARERMFWNPAAYQLWGQVYHDLTRDRPGLAGAITARAEAQVTRLALVYALLDGAKDVGEPHLRAALALWRYAEASAVCFFGDALGEPIADKILAALRTQGPLSQDDIYRNVLQRNIERDLSHKALAVLLDFGLITSEKQETGGRPRIVFTATDAAGPQSEGQENGT
jgi:hypothetical protein